MKSGLSLGALASAFRSFGRFFFEHNRMIYFVLFLSAVIGAIAGLNLILYQPSDEAYRTEKQNSAQSARFDTDTIEKIQQLNANQQTNTDEPPAGTRSNPFGE
ncbi:TPA: hypothetical protein DCF80_01540 [Candidatus Saccharibacteria bacterium]|nr:hypothetical protein [Candidatus Saccharibacteria bacterium]HRK40766.1 hypothetical protein [Candidatus Saccharibacteria bacterium]